MSENLNESALDEDSAGAPVDQDGFYETARADCIVRQSGIWSIRNRAMCWIHTGSRKCSARGN